MGRDRWEDETEGGTVGTLMLESNEEMGDKDRWEVVDGVSVLLDIWSADGLDTDHVG